MFTQEALRAALIFAQTQNQEIVIDQPVVAAILVLISSIITIFLLR